MHLGVDNLSFGPSYFLHIYVYNQIACSLAEIYDTIFDSIQCKCIVHLLKYTVHLLKYTVQIYSSLAENEYKNIQKK